MKLSAKSKVLLDQVSTKRKELEDAIKALEESLEEDTGGTLRCCHIQPYIQLFSENDKVVNGYLSDIVDEGSLSDASDNIDDDHHYHFNIDGNPFVILLDKED